MTRDEAIRLIIREGLAEDGVVVLIRMGEDPGAGRMAALLDALRVVQTSLRSEPFLDRVLANALYGLGFHVQGALADWISRRVEWRAGFLDDEIVPMFESIESIFGEEGEES